MSTNTIDRVTVHSGAPRPTVVREKPHEHYQPSAHAEVTLLRLPQVLDLIPVSRSSWWAGVKEGRFPAPVMIGPRTAAWRLSDLRALVDSFGSASGNDR
jgi:predicted DNA-binding transcriptional regulator AlpA